MASWTSRHLLSLPTLLATTSLLAACGGGSQETSNQTAASGPTSSLYSQLSTQTKTEWTSNEAKSTAAASTESRFYAPGVESSISAASPPASTSSGPSGQDADAFTLTFHDSFDGGLDRSAWNINDGAGGSTSNYAITNGSLKVWPARGENGDFYKRTLDTNGLFSQRYGYFEMEAKLPKGSGVWPGFWMVGMNGEQRPEIDIMEAYPGGLAPWGAPDANGIPTSMMYSAVVWRDADDRAGHGKIDTPDLSAGFHRYGAKWEPNKVTFYFDGREVSSVDASLSQPMHMILSLWFGSASGETNSSTPTGESNAYEINYVKAWQFK